jgi:hypothetical protein
MLEERNVPRPVKVHSTSNGLQIEKTDGINGVFRRA